MTPDDDVMALREAIAEHARVMDEDSGALLVPYEEYRAAIEAYQAACEPVCLGRILDRLEAAERDAARLKFEPIASAPKTGETVLLRIPTRCGKRDKWIASSGYWEPRVGGFWVIVNADEAIQRVEPTGWLSLKGTP